MLLNIIELLIPDTGESVQATKPHLGCIPSRRRGYNKIRHYSDGGQEQATLHPAHKGIILRTYPRGWNHGAGHLQPWRVHNL